jgi:hypothetical protein
MKTENKYNSNKLKISKIIQKIFPELWKYTGEKPAKFSVVDSLKINMKNLIDDFDSLDSLIKHYKTFYITIKYVDNYI